MTHNRLINHCLICALIFVTGLGLAFVLPLLASSQGFAAKSEMGEQGNAPEATRYYVAKTGDGTTGLDWTKAFTNVQDALAVAVDPSEIFVAKGVYYPDVGGGQSNNNRYSTFVITNGVVLYGGFEFGDTDITDRDWEKNLTILSGDIDKNDITPDGVVNSTNHIIGNNAYHVVTANRVGITAVLDGLTITAGSANHLGETNGGGLYCRGSGNGNACSPTLKNVTFSGNKAGEYGGGMCNSATLGGKSNPRLINITFSGNSASYGGAIFNGGIFGDNTGSSSPELINVLFSGNDARSGGAMYNIGTNSSPILTNVTFSGNRADRDGGAMYNLGISNMVVSNSIFWNNQDDSGTGTISSTIHNEFATITLVCSLVQGTGGSNNWTSNPDYVDGGYNIDQNPMFITPVDPIAAPTSAGNLRLQSNSPAIDAGNNNVVTASTDLDGEPRIVDGDMDGTPTVDMGAYEFGDVTYIPLIFR